MAGLNFFSSSSKRSGSSESAKERLKFVLVHDRADITLQQMDQMKNDIIAVISRYVEIDPTEVVININHEGRGQKLTADIPLKANRRR